MTDEKYLRYYKKKRFGIDNWLRRRAQSETKSAQRFWQAYEMLDLQLIECDHNYHLTDENESVRKMIDAIDGDAGVQERLDEARSRICKLEPNEKKRRELFDVLKLVVTFGDKNKESKRCLAIKLASPTITPTEQMSSTIVRSHGSAKSSASSSNNERKN